jgi:PPK2 family polyphosphate:nucleotide phosphotransferase
VADRFQVRPGYPANLSGRDPSSTEGAPGGKAETEAVFAEQHEKLAELQVRLWAEARRSMLIVLQGIDASGKDGTIRYVFGGFNPLGTRAVAFKEPTSEELAHDFLWRVHRQAPRAGEIVIFNRSHYEDVLAARVHRSAPEHVWRSRYEHINDFERLLMHRGTKVVKFLLHISSEEQAARLRSRIDRPDKRWKLQAEDFADRRYWDQYQAAFTDMLERTSTDQSPWYVIPADHKWYRNWAVAQVLIRIIRDMDPKYPKAAPLPDLVTLEAGLTGAPAPAPTGAPVSGAAPSAAVSSRAH